MSRLARVVYKDNPHHITQRGNNKQKIFKEKEDYEKYINWLKEYIEKNELRIISYCLMPNHVHYIAIPKKNNSMNKTFSSCHMRYAQYFNKKNEQTGHVWQGRFYSCILDEKHLYEAVRYVENNPKKAKLVDNSEEWEYSSAKAHIEGEDKRNIIDLELTKEYITVKDWKKYLLEKEEKEIVEEVKTNTKTGYFFTITSVCPSFNEIVKLYNYNLISCGVFQY